MTSPTDSTSAEPTSFVDADLHGARFVRCDLSGAVMRAVDLGGADIDAPWLLDGQSTLTVNGVDVAPLVEAELNRRFPGRGERRAATPGTARRLVRARAGVAGSYRAGRGDAARLRRRLRRR